MFLVFILGRFQTDHVFFGFTQLYGEELENKGTLLAVFNYVECIEEFVPDSQEATKVATATQDASSSKSKRAKMCSYPASSSLSTDSIQPQLYEVCHGPYNMADCTMKLKRIGFNREALFDAIDFFANDLQRRQAFMTLEDPYAFTYASRHLNK